MPQLLEKLDKEIEELSKLTQSNDFYQQDHVAQAVILDKLAKKNEELEEAFEKWEALEQKRSQM